MKAHLMYKDRDFDPRQLLARRDRYRNDYSTALALDQLLPWNNEDMTKDLELDIVCRTMAGEDQFLFEVAKVAMVSSLRDIDTVRYRQQVLGDCQRNAGAVREMYEIAVDAINAERTDPMWVSTKRPSSILYRSAHVLTMFVEKLKRLRVTVDKYSGEFGSEGFTRMFTLLQEELTDEYFATVEKHLRHLEFRDGVLISSQLGIGNKGNNYVLRKSPEAGYSWIGRFLAGQPTGYTFQIDPQDEVGNRTFSELKDAGLNRVADAAAQSVDHILGFFRMMRTELAFYIGCLNLQARLLVLGEPTCTPVPASAGERRLSFLGLYDISLALISGRTVIGNDLTADGKNLCIVTGANTGGKSTFLRSVGLAQLMMQAGMFVPAKSFRAEVCEDIVTHFKREEDQRMRSGKWDEELKRMSGIVDHCRPNAIILFNESFASTNEREGSEIADQIVRALLARHIKVFFVTHLYSFAARFVDRKADDVTSLLAERRPDGTRPFKLVEGKPLETSYGEDLYNQVFGKSRVQ
jgi:hypothetical protein